MILDIKTSIIEHDEDINDGHTLYAALTIFETSFICMLWYSNNEKLLICEDNFLKLFGVTDTKELPFYDLLIDDISYII